MSTYTEQELAKLSDAEREAVLELENDEAENAKRHTEGDTDDRRRLKGEEDDDAPAAKAPEVAPAAEVVTPPAAKVETPPAEPIDPPGRTKPLFDIKPVENFEGQITDIKAAKLALTAKVEEGDLTYGEAEVEREKLNDQEYALRRDNDRYELNENNRQQQEKDAWGQSCDAFMDAHTEYGASKMRSAALNAVVIELATDPANGSMTGPQLLAKAHETVEADLGRAPGAKAPTVTSKSPAIPEITGIRNMPAAEANEVAENRFAHLDRMKGLELEDALKKLPKADYDQYMKTN